MASGGQHGLAQSLLHRAAAASCHGQPAPGTSTVSTSTLPVLLKSLAIVAVCAVPCMLIFAFGAHPLLAAVFGASKAIASSSLLPLGAAFTVLATTFLAVQYMLALKRVWFLPPLALVAAIEAIAGGWKS